MSDNYICGGRRNKKKDKRREKKKNPYKVGGKFRASGVREMENASKDVTNLKKGKNKKKKK
jgi:hypothetical protein